MSSFISALVNIPETMAVGLGLYATSGSGSGEYEFEDDTNPDYDLDTDTEREGFGFVIDSAVANDRVFNYRMNIGRYYWEEEFENGTEFDVTGFMWTHDFGFGVVRNRFMRLWLGPEIRFAWGHGDDDDNDGYDVYMYSAGVGPVVGLNLHLGPVVSLGIKAGYLFETIYGNADDDVDDIEIDGGDHLSFVNLSLLFRIKDWY